MAAGPSIKVGAAAVALFSTLWGDPDGVVEAQ
jgi:hypothetical protein